MIASRCARGDHFFVVKETRLFFAIYAHAYLQGVIGLKCPSILDMEELALV